MSLAAGVDFGTQSVRVAIVDSEAGPLGSGTAPIPLERRRDDPDFATQSHADQMEALVGAMRAALADAGVEGSAVAALALDTTASSVVPLDERLRPLDDYMLWCDHRAHREAATITRCARDAAAEAIRWCGDAYSSEWGFSKMLFWLRTHPDGPRPATFAEHCDAVAATLCGIESVAEMPRSICAMGHKWMWNAELGGLPSEELLTAIDPLLAGWREKLGGRYATSDAVAGTLCSTWAARLGLREGIPIPVGGIDAHWDAIGSGVREGDVVNVVGTSTCIMAVVAEADLIPGVCGMVRGSIHPAKYGIEAGLSATGDAFEAIARRAGASVSELSSRLAGYRAGQTGLLRLVWDNGDRNVLINPNLGGVTLGWNLTHGAEDELFAAIEGTALHTGVIFDRLRQYGVSVDRVINAGGIPQKNDLLNQVYANALGLPVEVPAQPATGLGAAIFALLAAGAFPSVEAGQQQLCPPFRTVEPQGGEAVRYEELDELFRRVYYGLGDPAGPAAPLGDVLPRLRALAEMARRG
ncbi:MAG: ribulokinase [Acidobacteria bacterium]|nr:ribulokinase [Acidobacteriota bacterium]